LELPIDHFRLLGVGPSTDAQAVLHMLHQRLNRVPEDGFSPETLQARAELLRSSADLLSDSERRASYEADLTALAATGEHVMPALDVPSAREVAGLLLLLEAGQPLDCFELARRGLQPPQAPALGSNREADLTLLAGLACLDSAEEFQQQRRYEAAATTLQQGLELLQRMGQLPELRERMSADLDHLAPYRVLDLLSRDPMAREERSEGLALLEQLVQRRGGLEGEGDPAFGKQEFQAFFKQIRAFLTVQEQVDLFSRWGDGGSAAADFLATTALTASGFAQRKPERIAEARERLVASGRNGIEPLLANLHLLLGEVDAAKAAFHEGAGRELQAWAARQSDDSLGQVCAYCRDWLARDVLPGYRDLDADADLDAYFSDRDVIAYVEREDRRSGRMYGAASGPLESSASSFAPTFGPSSFTSPSFAPVSGEQETPAGDFELPSWFLEPLPSSASRNAAADPFGDLDLGGDTIRPSSHPADLEEEEAPLGWSLPRLPRSLPRFFPQGWPGVSAHWLLPATAAVGVARVAGSWLFRPRSPAPPAKPSAVSIPVQPVSSRPAGVPVLSAGTGAVGSAPAASGAAPAVDRSAAPTASATSSPTASATAASTTPVGAGKALTSAAPSSVELQSLLERWLAAKTAVLAGQEKPADLELLAQDGAIDHLLSERRQDQSQQQTQKLSARITDLTITERSPNRIAVRAVLNYSDARLDASGKEVDRTAPTTLRNLYVFGRDGEGWRLVATRPAD
jgi:hypothetical protein